MLELIVSRYGERDRLEVDDVDGARRLAEMLSDEGLAHPIMVVEGDVTVLSYEELMGKWCAGHLPVDEAAIAAGL